MAQGVPLALGPWSRLITDLGSLLLHWRTSSAAGATVCVVEHATCPALKCPDVRCGDCSAGAGSAWLLWTVGLLLCAAFSLGAAIGASVVLGTSWLAKRPESARSEQPRGTAASAPAAPAAPQPSAEVSSTRALTAPARGFVTPSQRHG